MAEEAAREASLYKPSYETVFAQMNIQNVFQQDKPSWTDIPFACKKVMNDCLNVKNSFQPLRLYL